jgi:hypothetical protein
VLPQSLSRFEGGNAPGPAHHEMNRTENMEILHIGGIADKGTMNLPESVKASRHSFKPDSDFPSDVLRHDDYERKYFLIEQIYLEPQKKV